MLRNTAKSWGSVARAFHWIMAIMIIGMIGYGWWMNHIPARPDRYFYRLIHADIGYLVLLLLFLRLLWRRANPVPALPPGTSRWMRLFAIISHTALYLATFIVIMLGWAHSGAAKRPYTSWFGLFDVPQFTSTDRAKEHLYEDLHIYGAYILLALIGLHLAAALYRHFVKRDGTLQRMLNGKPA